jgi:hypothetical protein
MARGRFILESGSLAFWGGAPCVCVCVCVCTRENTTALPQAPAGVAGGVGVDRVATAPAMAAAARTEADSMDMAASYTAEAIAAVVRRAEVEIRHMRASAQPEARTTFERYAYA